MKEDVLTFNEQYNLFNQGDHLFLAVSGGIDSMAMLHFFAEINKQWDLNLTTLTVDHQLRHGESEADAQFVKEQSEALGIPCEVISVDVKRYQKKYQVGVQEAARELRYDAFKKYVGVRGKLVLAHHGDDQVETMYMQLTKGLVPTGMKASRSLYSMNVIRPFLNVAKTDLTTYMSDQRLPHREDPTNQDDQYTRNRFRNHLLPFIKQENKNIHKSVRRVHEQLSEDEALLTQLAEREMGLFSQFCEQKVTFSIKSFVSLPQPLQRRGFHLILNYLSVNTDRNQGFYPSFIDWLTSNQPNSTWSPNEQWRAIKSYDECTITVESDKALEPYNIELNLGGKATLPNGWTLSVELYDDAQQVDLNRQLLINVDESDLPLMIRSRMPGDRVKPLGLKGSKKVKDIFIDEKIPKVKRDSWPIVESKQGEIIWVPFIVKSEFVSRTGALKLKLTIEGEQD
ncbi:tRNA lysidine(34) synthetase TilS [Alkalibacillus haloalkaliphilus]|uniref:tRNA(Ile)-lysidine synthase n=1 Tax=Alkalibacillus haloalkaliphilus TaxID=94136 RepID=A0A511W0X4_9BACI|nr:tRNA lysidine(34) synthetase TilS [Alkalibacillus haloalkaliphilus]GEN44749.1 tRNA(Ile)-lysidine synthase [Alkalibacillus haloalkaliphilus]